MVDLNLIPVSYVRLGGKAPIRSTEGAAGWDVHAYLPDGYDVFMEPAQTVVIPTGIRLAAPPGYGLFLYSRSGLAKRGIVVANGVGVVDSDYRGEIKVLLRNTSHSTFRVRNGDRVAQAVLHEVKEVVWQEVDTLPDTARGSGGFGSTGISR